MNEDTTTPEYRADTEAAIREAIRRTMHIWTWGFRRKILHGVLLDMDAEGPLAESVDFHGAVAQIEMSIHAVQDTEQRINKQMARKIIRAELERLDSLCEQHEQLER